MPQAHIHLDNPSVATAFANYLSQTLATADTFHLALSGGSTPKLLFAELAEHYGKQIDWQKVHLYWGDERCVPPEDNDSNYKMTKEKLLSWVDLPADNIHRIRGEANPQEEAQRYAKLLQKQLPKVNGIPVFDLVLLGMGSDGHTASIFPDRMDFLNGNEICVVATHPDSGQQRISLTGPVINAAKQIHFLVTGAAKAPIVKQIFSQEGAYQDYPAAHIQATAWWLDTAAVWA